MRQTTIYFDLGSPFAYLSVERARAVLPGPVALRPVLLGGLFKLNGRSSWALGDPERRRDGMAEVERRARAIGLPPLRWPDPWPGDYLTAMRVATFAQQTGVLWDFVERAFHSAFAEGNDLSQPAHVLRAAAAAGLDAQAVEAAVAAPEVKSALRDATDAAHRLGVFGVPTMAVGEQLLWGDDRLEDAARAVDRIG
ncbi:MAG TPA: DsbA family protein [Solirubrobacteraceae bacterium]|nr:DsbA family protein [Solirubrobacteraceae bacterium]